MELKNYEILNSIIGVKTTYGKMCELLGTKTKTGKSKQLHLEDIEREFELSKTPKGIIVVRELDEIEKEAKEVRRSSLLLDFPNIRSKDSFKKGVYMLKNGDNVYIGVTLTTFAERYVGHRSKTNSCTSKLVLEGNKKLEFEILYEIKESKDIQIAKDIEWAFIMYYKLYSDYNVVNVNDRMSVYSYNFSEDDREGLTSIKIERKELDKVLSFLKESDIRFKTK